MSHKALLTLCFVLLTLGGSALLVEAQGPKPTPPKPKAPSANVGTAFTYQGQLKTNGALITGSCNLAFRLYDDPSAGTSIGSAITQTIPITNGLFTTQLNASNEFGANAFNGEARWLEIRVSNTCPSSGSFTTLSPREAVSPAPYALTSLYTAYKNVLVVTTSGGHYNSIAAAVNSISDNTTTNRYLIWVAPGIYNERVTMKPFVDIEGSGELNTKITFAGSVTDTTGTVVGANDAELRFLTAENTGGAANAIAIYNGGTAPRLTHVTGSAAGGTNNIGIHNDGAAPTMQNVTASASGGTYSIGIRDYYSSSPMMADVIASASGGTNSYGIFNFSSSSPIMTNISTTATGGTDNRGVYNTSASSPKMTQVSASASGGANSYGVVNTLTSSPKMKDITASASGGTTANFGVYNYSSSSPVMTSVSASASGGGDSYGVYNDTSSSPLMTEVTASASGGGVSSINYGVYNITGSLPKMTNIIATASGGGTTYAVYDKTSGLLPILLTNVTANSSGATFNFALYNQDSITIITNSFLNGIGGTASYGIYTHAVGIDGYVVMVRNSVVNGDTRSIYNESGTTTNVGGSQLSGGAVLALGSVACAGVYDETFAFYPTTCP